ncbi:hypothetical protein COX93_01630 [Candidatus Nomurabacteria bacterium CG_4_10_14_0_2_um_filter_30_12]|uniref:Uncharacterized protein n=3 Tax=Candidatus Nomuraibacteriota TaxID=1752729 RepID=A0A1J4V4Q3_9BACT|nr:MAG: hypothetical protein AUJ22_01655 [Candidatus Nomurabacteria bacterium CG1_02_31_12]PIR68888.1 MAG: hypothetical protein COU48_01640 [Candidatus Nomurabacteria bacterium CG10_big_fil_rev_8_21_14_0_10_03_31_7]PIZ87275.1 MAG: hypothetical protein COX93_01630 [Candidatus Nomurabacteria bacterium CG_4_10_14_0_2_um_filter_30_12]
MKNFLSISLRWALICSTFVIITILSVDHPLSALNHYKFSILGAGFIYLAIFHFIKSEDPGELLWHGTLFRYTIIVGLCLLIFLVVSLFKIKEDNNLWNFMTIVVFFAILTVQIIDVIVNIIKITKGSSLNDGLLSIEITALIGGILYFISVESDWLSWITYYEDWFDSLGWTTIIGYPSIILVTFMPKIWPWLFLTKPKNTVQN